MLPRTTRSLIRWISGVKYDFPLAPAPSTAVGSVVGPLLDFAVVSVQMRGTGCRAAPSTSSACRGTFDGYDMIETVGNQSWVKGGKVGMGGISFSGITQLFSGRHPAAAPRGDIADVGDRRSLPGLGVSRRHLQRGLRAGVAHRPDGGRPPGARGRPGLGEGADPGGRRALHREPEDAPAEHRRRSAHQGKGPYRSDERFDERAPASWIDKIEVPVFWVGQYQDEQTGGHFVESLSKLDDNEDVWITLQNGVHADSLGPSSIVRWIEFMNLFVADRIPVVPPTVLSSSGALYRALADAPALPVSQSRFAGYTDVDQARAEFMRDPRVRLLMDNGAALEGSPGAIGAAWEMNYDSWPVRQAKPTPYDSGPRGRLLDGKPKGSGRRTISPTRAPGPPRPSTATTRPTRGGRSRPTTGLRSRSAEGWASRAPSCAGTP